jgi:hypothetical protein
MRTAARDCFRRREVTVAGDGERAVRRSVRRVVMSESTPPGARVKGLLGELDAGVIR